MHWHQFLQFSISAKNLITLINSVTDQALVKCLSRVDLLTVTSYEYPLDKFYVVLTVHFDITQQLISHPLDKFYVVFTVHFDITQKLISHPLDLCNTYVRILRAFTYCSRKCHVHGLWRHPLTNETESTNKQQQIQNLNWFL
jgi:hypothetical protein